MEQLNLGPYRGAQKALAQKALLQDSSALTEVTTVGAFSVTFTPEGKVVCAAIVMKYPSFEVLEKKTLEIDAPMKYIPGYEAFRAGPPLLQLYYELEYDPQIIFIEGTGALHPVRAGLASYLGVELEKPVIGIAKSASIGERNGDDIIFENEVLARFVKTREYANEVVVSPGHLISLDTACEWVKKTIVAPHKRPEPLHIAARLAKKSVKKEKDEPSDEQSES